jgi:hypothetical protein
VRKGFERPESQKIYQGFLTQRSESSESLAMAFENPEHSDGLVQL